MFVLHQCWAVLSQLLIYFQYLEGCSHTFSFLTQIFLLLSREGEGVGGAKCHLFFCLFFILLTPLVPRGFSDNVGSHHTQNVSTSSFLSFFSLPILLFPLQLSTYTCQDAFLFLCSHHCLFYCLSSPGLIWSLSWPSHLSVCVSLCVPSLAPRQPPHTHTPL